MKTDFLKQNLINHSDTPCLYRAISDIPVNNWQFIPVYPETISWIPIRNVDNEISEELIFPINEEWRIYSKSYLNECFTLPEITGLLQLLDQTPHLRTIRIEKYLLPLNGNHMGVESCWLHNFSAYLVYSLRDEFGIKRIESVFNGELNDVLGIIRIPESLENYNKRMEEVSLPINDAKASSARDEEDFPI